MSRSSTMTVFLDRDGTINESPVQGEYVVNPDDLRLMSGSGEAIRRLNSVGATVIVVTNQRCVSLGLMSEEALEEVHDKMADDLAHLGARVDGVYACTHGIGACECRKPKPGLLLRALIDRPELAATDLFMVGDSPTDVAAGRGVGARTVLIGPAGGDRAGADHVSEDLGAAADWILAK